MKHLVLLLSVLSLPLLAQKQELKEVQRDVGILSDELRTMKTSVEELKGMLQQILDQNSRNATALAKLETGFRERLQQQEKSVLGPVSGVGTKVDAMSDEFRYVKESIAEMVQRMGRLDQKLTDTNNAISVLQAPAAPPSAPNVGPPPGVSSASLYKDAMRDKGSGNYDLAIQELSDYLKWFGSTDDAPLAEYYLGEVYYTQKQYDKALVHFDAVLEKYPKNSKTLDAQFMKGRSLVRTGQADAGAAEFRAILKNSPNSDQATSARQELKNLGLSVGATPAPPKKKR